MSSVPGVRQVLREPAAIASTRRLVDGVADRLDGEGWPRGARDDVVLAVDEAVQNAVEHGSEPMAPVTVEVEIAPAEARVVVRDHGRVGRPTPDGPPPLPEPHQIRGRGRIIMAALADRARWHRRQGGGTEVELVFSRPGGGDGPASPRGERPVARSAGQGCAAV